MRRSYPLGIYSFTALALLALAQPGYGDTTQSKIREGVSSYQKQEYEKASQLFQDAYAKQPENSELAYNLANSNYKSGKFDQATDAYTKAMNSDDSSLKQKALYNSGNALYRMKRLEDAAAAYKKSLELNPNDMDAKFNLEFVREQLKKQKQQNDKKKQDKENQESSKDKQSGNDQQQNNSDQENQQQESKNKKEDNQSQQNKNQQEQEKQKNKENKNTPQQFAQNSRQKPEMSKEEAEQWLRSLTENPKKLIQKQIQDQLKQEKVPVGNDW